MIDYKKVGSGGRQVEIVWNDIVNVLLYKRFWMYKVHLGSGFFLKHVSFKTMTSYINSEFLVLKELT